MAPKTAAPANKPSFRTKGLAQAWEGVDGLRNRVREHGKLFMHPKSQKVAANTIGNAILNQEVLKPALVRLRVAKGKMPAIDDLIEECTKLYAALGREVDSQVPSKDGWTLRRMLSWIKRKALRKEVGKESKLQEPCHMFILLSCVGSRFQT